MNQHLRFASGASLVLFLTSALSAAPDLYVATDGNDAWSGRFASPNAQKSDGPLATVLAARDAVRKSRAAQPNSGPVTVHIRGGTYYLAAPLLLEPQDSGTADAPVVYQAYQNEKPILSGGRLITGWKKNGLVWETTLGERVGEHASARGPGDWSPRQLFVDGARRTPARSPNHGYFRIAELIPGPMDPTAKRPVVRDRFKFAAGDLKAWPDLSDVSLTLMHSWETSIHPLKSVDEQSRIVEFVAPMREWWSIGYWEDHARYFVEGAREMLDQAGEWHLGRKTGVLTYWPNPSEAPDTVVAVAPLLTELVRFAGDADKGQFVDHVTLRGISFQHNDWVLDPKGNSSTQAAVNVPAAIMADGARHCAIESCEVAHSGTYAIWLRRGCKENRIQKNRLHDLGAGGVRVGEDQMAKTDAAESSHNLIDNNHIFDGGRIYPGCIGIWVAQSSHNRITHNDIHDFYYSGMSLGWNWNDDANRTHHNIVEHNHIHHLGHGVMSDMGLIYCLGVSTGSVIRNNLLHDIWPYDAPAYGWGIYFDGTCGGFLAENNVVYNTRSGGIFYNNGGHSHTIRNNIFAHSADYAMWPYWEKRPSTFKHNIVYLSQGELFIWHAQGKMAERQKAGDPLGTWEKNVYWHTGGPGKLRFFRSNRTLEAWQKHGLDATSIVADPMFVDPANYDFRLKEGSPALKLGFQPIDLSKVGLYGDADWVNEPKQRQYPRTVLPPPPASRQPQQIDDDFEQTPVGEPPRLAHVDKPEDGASIRISDEHAAGGKRSLKITDSKAIKPSWKPHFYYTPNLSDGTVRQSFDMRLEAGAQIVTEWRDELDYPRNVGPSVMFDNGKVLVRGKQLTTIPAGKWVHVDIETAIGTAAKRTFDLSIVVDGKTERFADLPISGGEFREIYWLGFSTPAATDAAVFIDNLKIRVLSAPPAP